MTFLISFLSVAVALGLVIFIHEFGHFIVAKKSGVRVDRFSFGLGPEMIGFQWGETRYCLAWIPLGGEVRMAGEMDPGMASEKPKDPREFFALPWYRRIPIVVAGPAMNYVLAFLLFSGVFWIWGNPSMSEDPLIGEVAQGYPAQVAGLQAGDRVLFVNDTAIDSWKSLAEVIHGHPGVSLALRVRRGEDPERTVTVTPRADPTHGHGLIGITPTPVYEKLSLAQSLGQGAFQTWYWSWHTVDYLMEKFIRREKPELSGPVGIVSVISKSAQSGWQDYLFLIAMISLGIGLFNLFPIPMLDGGHLVFYLLEGLLRRPIKPSVVRAANVVGLSVLLTILVFATYSDVKRLRTPKPTDAVQEK